MAAKGPYTIKMKINEEESEARQQGDFRLVKNFEVLNAKGNPMKTGCIVQLVQKRTTAYQKDTTGKDNTGKDNTGKNNTGKDILIEDISAFTSGKVNYMNFDYIEMFEFKENEFVGDAFANGSIAKYEIEEGDLYAQIPNGENAHNIQYLTKGTIKIVGTLIYISKKADAIRIGKFALPLQSNHPANGLLVASSVDRWEGLLQLNEATPIKQHIVTVTWDYASGKPSMSQVHSEFQDILSGGRGKKIKKRNLTRKKKMV